MKESTRSLICKYVWGQEYPNMADIDAELVKRGIDLDGLYEDIERIILEYTP